MDCSLLDKLCNYIILNQHSKQFFQPSKSVLISPTAWSFEGWSGKKSVFLIPKVSKIDSDLSSGYETAPAQGKIQEFKCSIFEKLQSAPNSVKGAVISCSCMPNHTGVKAPRYTRQHMQSNVGLEFECQGYQQSFKASTSVYSLRCYSVNLIFLSRTLKRSWVAMWNSVS